MTFRERIASALTGGTRAVAPLMALVERTCRAFGCLGVACAACWAGTVSAGAEPLTNRVAVAGPAEVRRVPLLQMTAGVLLLQAATAARFHSDWHERGHKWVDGFRYKPAPDTNDPLYNYGMHPWVGSEYYLLARNRGGTMLESCGYSALISAVWEYGAENFLQQPSARDLIVTPFAGTLIGELRYRLKQHWLEQAGRKPSRKLWAALLDPVDMTLGGYPDGKLHLFLNCKTTF